MARLEGLTKDDPRRWQLPSARRTPTKTSCLRRPRLAKTGEGHQGVRGRLFSVSADFMQAIFDDLPGYNTAFIFENVLMNAADAKTVTEKLGCQPVFACAGDFGQVTPETLVALGQMGRPYLRPVRWLSLGLGEKGWLSPPAPQLAQEGGHRPTASMLMWPRANTCRALPRQRLLMRGGQPRNPTGRTPKDAQESWLADKRQYAPWHYKREAMLTSPTGEMCIPPAFVKEQLHEILHKILLDKSRHRLLGNGHWGVAARLLAILVSSRVASSHLDRTPSFPPDDGRRAGRPTGRRTPPPGRLVALTALLGAARPFLRLAPGLLFRRSPATQAVCLKYRLSGGGAAAPKVAKTTF